MKKTIAFIFCLSILMLIGAGFVFWQTENAEQVMTSIAPVFFSIGVGGIFVSLIGWLLFRAHTEEFAVGDRIEQYVKSHFTAVTQPSPEDLLDSLQGASLLSKGSGRRMFHGYSGLWQGVPTSVGQLSYYYDRSGSTTQRRDVIVVASERVFNPQQDGLILPEQIDGLDYRPLFNEISQMFEGRPCLKAELLPECLVLYFNRNAWQEIVHGFRFSKIPPSEQKLRDLEVLLSLSLQLRRELEK